MPEKDLGSRLSDQTTRHIPSDSAYNEQNKIRFSKIKKEKMVAVNGNPLFKPILGDVYSFDYQDYPVTIEFNGKDQFYPETIATILRRKLDAAARVNAPKAVGDGDKLY
jgi:hypothetical protein